MNSLLIKTKLIVGFSVLFFFLLILGGYSYYSVATIQDKSVEISTNSMVGTEVLNHIMDEANYGRRCGMLRALHTNPAEIAAMDKEIINSGARMEQSIGEYKDLIENANYKNIADKETDIKLITEIEELWKEYQGLSKEIALANLQGEKDKSLAILTGKSNDIYNKLFEKIKEALKINKNTIHEKVEEGNAIYHNVALLLI